MSLTDFGPLLSLATLIKQVIGDCADAPDKFREVTRLLSTLEGVLIVAEKRMRNIVGVPPNADAQTTSASGYDPTLIANLQIIIGNCSRVVDQLNILQLRYSGLDTGKRNFLEKIAYSHETLTQELSNIRQELGFDINALQLFLSSRDWNEHLPRPDSPATTLKCNPQAGTSVTRPTLSSRTSSDTLVEEAAETANPASKAPEFEASACSWDAEAVATAFQARHKQLLALLTPELAPALDLLTYGGQGELKVPDPSCRYSENDEYLSQLPEGWQRRCDGPSAYRYHYQFQRPCISRSYSYVTPFPGQVEVEQVSPAVWEIIPGGDYRTFYRNRATGHVTTTKPSAVMEFGVDDLFVGFKSKNGLPFDLLDDCTVDLANHLYIPGEGASEVEITGALPTGWTYSRAADGRLVYHWSNTASSPGWTSTVHPALFEDQKHKKCPQLPEGWDRRLDTWGMVFYVHHGTASWQREAPTP